MYRGWQIQMRSTTNSNPNVQQDGKPERTVESRELRLLCGISKQKTLPHISLVIGTQNKRN